MTRLLTQAEFDAAIASAEARARLQIDYLLHRIEVLSCSGCMDGESKHPHWGQVWHGRPEPFTGEWIPTRRCMSQRESAAEAAAARTPDSTQQCREPDSANQLWDVECQLPGESDWMPGMTAIFKESAERQRDSCAERSPHIKYRVVKYIRTKEPEKS